MLQKRITPRATDLLSRRLQSSEEYENTITQENARNQDRKERKKGKAVQQKYGKAK